MIPIEVWKDIISLNIKGEHPKMLEKFLKLGIGYVYSGNLNEFKEGETEWMLIIQHKHVSITTKSSSLFRTRS